jgi:hypothetical protein
MNLTPALATSVDAFRVDALVVTLEKFAGSVFLVIIHIFIMIIIVLYV